MADEADALSTPAVDSTFADDAINRTIGSPVPPSDLSAMTKIYHIKDGESPWMYKIDARMACARFPQEWSETPWPAAPAGKGGRG